MPRVLEQLTYTVPEAAQVIGVSDDTLRRVIKRGDFPVLRIGSRVLIAKIALNDWIERNAAASFRTITKVVVGSQASPRLVESAANHPATGNARADAAASTRA
jgi:excisionase family DNA binding protein